MTSFLARLPFRAVLEFEGPDARSFLQGQTTCDVEQLSAGQSVVGAYCNPQGRMVCDFRLLEDSEERVLMLLEADVVEAAVTTFSKYIVFSKATLRDASDDWACFALWGEAASEFTGAAGRDSDLLWARADVEDAVEICLPTDQVASLEDRFTGAQRPEGDQYRLMEIQAGIGHVTGTGSGEFLPQMLNYQAVGRINFKKGCYTGQEVVARMHYRGQVKRPMALASTTAAVEVQTGDAVLASGSEKSVGSVINAERDGDGQLWILASVTRDAVASGAELAGSPLQFHALPYALDDG